MKTVSDYIQTLIVEDGEGAVNTVGDGAGAVKLKEVPLGFKEQDENDDYIEDDGSRMFKRKQQDAIDSVSHL